MSVEDENALSLLNPWHMAKPCSGRHSNELTNVYGKLEVFALARLAGGVWTLQFWIFVHFCSLFLYGWLGERKRYFYINCLVLNTRLSFHIEWRGMAIFYLSKQKLGTQH